MGPTSSSAYLLSALMHGLVAALLLLFTYSCQQQVAEPQKILELVAGPGDNYAATVAPALGGSAGVKIAVPEPLPVVKQPEPAAPEVSPVTPAPEPIITKAPPVKSSTPPIPDISRQIKKKIIRAESTAKLAIKKAREAEQKRLTKEEFDRMNKAKVQRIDAEGIAKGVLGGSTANKVDGANGKALTSEEGGQLERYFAFLKQELKRALEKPPGLSDTLVAIAEMRIAADGTLSDARIKRSSGSEEFDHAVLEAIAHVHSIGPRPDGKSELINISFRMHEEDEN